MTRVKSNTKTTALIVHAYSLLDCLNDIKTGAPYRDLIYELSLVGERAHRRYAGKGEYKVSVRTAAKLFTVRALVQYATKDIKLPTVAGMLEMRSDYQLAAMVAANHSEMILKALAGMNLRELAAIDYVAMVEGHADARLQ